MPETSNVLSISVVATFVTVTAWARATDSATLVNSDSSPLAAVGVKKRRVVPNVNNIPKPSPSSKPFLAKNEDELEVELLFIGKFEGNSVVV